MSHKNGKNIICKTCRKEFYVSGNVLKSGRKYCSQKCYGDIMKGEKRPWVKNLPYLFRKGYTPWNKDKEFLAHSGTNHPFWKGDKVGYVSLHEWVRKKLGKPIKCEHCESTIKLEWANKSGKYLRDLTDWLSLCRNCHKKYDTVNNLNGAIQAKWPAWWEKIIINKRNLCLKKS